MTLVSYTSTPGLMKKPGAHVLFTHADPVARLDFDLQCQEQLQGLAVTAHVFDSLDDLRAMAKHAAPAQLIILVDPQRPVLPIDFSAYGELPAGAKQNGAFEIDMVHGYHSMKKIFEEELVPAVKERVGVQNIQPDEPKRPVMPAAKMPQANMFNLDAVFGASDPK